MAGISDVKAIIKRAAEQAGFDLSGIAPATDAADLEHFPAWIAAGHAGRWMTPRIRHLQKPSSMTRSREGGSGPDQ